MPALTPNRIKEQMTARKLSQRALAAKAGVSQSTVSEVLSGKHTPHPETLAKIAIVFEVGDAEAPPLPPGTSPVPEPNEAQVEERW